jgi:hypothetical protein
LDPLEYRVLKQKGLIRLVGAQATINRGEVCTIDKAALEAEIKKRKNELDILTELWTDLP